MSLNNPRGLTEFIAYVILRSFIFPFQILPFRFSLAITKLLGTLFHKILTKKRTLIEDNLRHAFPENTEEWIKKTSKKNFIQTTRILAEMASISKLKNESFFKRWVEIKPSRSEYRKIMKKGGVYMMGHIGSWEWNGHIASILIEENVYTFAKRISNAWVNDYVEKIRSESGISILYTDNTSLFKPISLIRKNKVISFISDQHAPNGEYISFMNRLAPTFLGPSAYAKRFPSLTYFLSSYRNENGKLIIEIEKIPMPKNKIGEEHDGEWDKEFTSNWVKILEKKIRAHPTDYFWIHNRWKGSPKNNKNESITNGQSDHT